MAKLELESVPDEWLDKIESSIDVGISVLRDEQGLRKGIEAAQVRAVDLLVSITKDKAHIAAIKAKRGSDEAEISKLRRDNEKLKAELARARGRATRAENQLKALMKAQGEGDD